MNALAEIARSEAVVRAPLPRFVAHGRIAGVRDEEVGMADGGLIGRFYEEVLGGGNLGLIDGLATEDFDRP